MWKKLLYWFIVFGLSFLFKGLFGWEQGKTFFWIYLGASIILYIALFIIYGTASTLLGNFFGIGQSIWAIILLIIGFGLVIFFTWVATKLFDIDFFVAYQVMSFGQCLVETTVKKDKKE